MRRRSHTRDVPLGMIDQEDLFDIVTMNEHKTRDVELIKKGERAVGALFSSWIRSKFSHPRVTKIGAIRNSVEISTRYYSSAYLWRLRIRSHIKFCFPGDHYATTQLSLHVSALTDGKDRNIFDSNDTVEAYDYSWWNSGISSSDEKQVVQNEIHEQLIQLAGEFVRPLGFTLVQSGTDYRNRPKWKAIRT